MGRLEENALFDSLARAGDGALIADSRGRIVLWNRSAERLLGWTASEAIGRSCSEVLDGHVAGGDGHDGGCAVMDAATRGDVIESFDVHAPTRSGQRVWLNVSTLALVSDDTGRLTIHLFREVADRRAGAAGVLDIVGGDHPPSPLTRREREVLRLLASGANTRMAAQRLGVSPATVRNHVQNMLGKLGVHSRLQAVAYATTHGLL